MGKTSYGKEILDYIMDHRQSGKLPSTTSLSFWGDLQQCKNEVQLDRGNI